ncbi:MAG: GNAT family N-acetyltransferase [Saprospiraceae bacterium]
MVTIIRKASEKDIPAIHSLVRELAEYEKGLDKVSTTSESYIKDFNDRVFDAFVAEKKGEVVGIALFFLVFSTWKGRMLYLEDFIVRDSERGLGIGAQLFEAFLEEAKRLEVALVKWQVLEWNEPAINFYKKYDVVFDDEWVDCKIYLYLKT